jgi:Haem-NO-binding
VKGTIIKCLEEMILATYGDAAWKSVLAGAGQPAWRIYTATDDLTDSEALALLHAAPAAVGESRTEVFQRFGEHWSTKYAPSLYRVYFDRANNARDFLLHMNNVHDIITRRMKNARPPRFVFDASVPQRLVIRYEGARGLAELMPGLVRGVAKYYREEVALSVRGNELTAVFSSAP